MSILKFSIRSLASIAVCSFAWAGTITENFTTQLYKDSNETSLIWNIGTGRLHPTQEVDSWKPFNGAMRTTDISFGDGRHGSFDTSTYAQFDDDHDISDGFIRINTNQYPELNVTNFTLESGYILEPVGDKPLIVLSQSDVRILGTAQILCSGKNGEDTKSPESSVSNGGSGRCGGSYGGQGGSYNGGYSASTKGFPQAGLTNPLGGNGGADNGFGGGGGGTYYDAAPPERGYDNNTGGASPVNGTQGSNYDNQDFSILLGGAGGGGGGAYYSGTPADPTNSSGAGGGGGGGVVVLYAQRDFYNEGAIYAKGGNGGVYSGAHLGGLGGGGGGGTVIVIAGGNYVNNGLIDTRGGEGGDRLPNNNGKGGDGASGRGWYTDNDGVLTGTGSEFPSCILEFCGSTLYQLGPLVAVSTSYDLSNSKPILESLDLDYYQSGTSQVTLQVAGSNDNFINDNSGWLPSTSLSALSEKRYFKFQITINNQEPVDTAYVDSLSLHYTETNKDEFMFVAGCGRIKTPSNSNPYHALSFLLMLLLPYLVALTTKNSSYNRKTL